MRAIMRCEPLKQMCEYKKFFYPRSLAQRTLYADVKNERIRSRLVRHYVKFTNDSPVYYENFKFDFTLV